MSGPRVEADVLAAVKSVLGPELIGEAVHAALRKGCQGGMAAHRAITEMPDGQWYAAMQFFTEGLLSDIMAAIAAQPAPAGQGAGRTAR